MRDEWYEIQMDGIHSSLEYFFFYSSTKWWRDFFFFFFSFRRSFSILDSLMGKRVLYYVWFTINNRRWLHVYFIIVFNVIQWILFAFSKLKKKIFQSITTIIWQHKAAVIRYILYSLTSKHANKPLAIYVHYLCNVRCIFLRKSNLISMSI